MFILTLRNRPATTLVELLMFTAFFAISSAALISLFFSTSEQRVRQQSISSVEQSGVQIMQTLSNRIRSAERILAPADTTSGSILALQLFEQSFNPTVIALSGAALYVGEANTMKRISAQDITISDFSVRNTSVDPTKGSVVMRFTVSQISGVSLRKTYSRLFEAAISLFPDDIVSEQCDCESPVCSDGTYQWQYCEAEVCHDSDVEFSC